jgi:hypothetical protein
MGGRILELTYLKYLGASLGQMDGSQNMLAFTMHYSDPLLN